VLTYNITFSAFDNQNYQCGVDFDLGGIDCENPDCRIENMVAYFVGCDENDTQTIQLDFDFFNTNLSGFDVYLNDQLFDYFPQNTVPLYLEGVEQIPGTGGVTITVCNNDNPDCCEELFVEWVVCDPAGCIGFEYFLQATAGESSGNAIGEVVYTENDIPFSVEEYIGPNGNTSFDILLVSIAEFYPGFPNGNGRFIYFAGIAGQWDFDQQIAPTTQVNMDFYYDGGPVNFGANGGERLILQNLQQGTYNLVYGTGVVQLEVVFETNASGQLIFTGNIEQLLVGGQNLGIDNVCPTISEDCIIENLIAEATDCENGEFYIDINFDHANTTGSFALWQNGNEIGLYSYSDLPIQIGPYGQVNQPLVF
jgi:hypothetical protein